MKKLLDYVFFLFLIFLTTGFVFVGKLSATPDWHFDKAYEGSEIAEINCNLPEKKEPVLGRKAIVKVYEIKKGKWIKAKGSYHLYMCWDKKCKNIGKVLTVYPFKRGKHIYSEWHYNSKKHR